MKKLATHDFEDLLQCSIPTFEDLLEEPHNKHLMKLLYRTAEWHAFAKLRVHTDSTLEHLEMLTKEFGFLMRQFWDLTCLQFRTTELPREVAARNRQQQPAQARVPSASSESESGFKTLNISTIKFHSLGDYVQMIQMFGCTDSFSTQLVWHLQPWLCTNINLNPHSTKGKLAHCLVKQLYRQTNKRDATKQIRWHVRQLEHAQRRVEMA